MWYVKSKNQKIENFFYPLYYKHLAHIKLTKKP